MPIGDLSYTMSRVHVENLTAATTKAKSLGATVLKDTIEVRAAGSFRIITDPTGAVLGLWQPKMR